MKAIETVVAPIDGSGSGSRVRSSARRLVLGGVATTIVGHSPVPVLVVP